MLLENEQVYFLQVTNTFTVVVNYNNPGSGLRLDLFPENAGGRDRCPATGTTSLRDLSPDRGGKCFAPLYRPARNYVRHRAHISIFFSFTVVPDLMTGNEPQL